LRLPKLLQWARARLPLVILSDTFYELAQPMMQRLEHPLLIDHKLIVDRQDRIVDFQLRGVDQK
jgi:phosphoserine/homoserine phosphotransferase